MTPPGSGDSRPPRRLSLVQPANGSAAREVAPSEPVTPASAPVSARPPFPTLPPRSADLAGLSRIITGQTALLSPYEQMLSHLVEVANPTANRGYDFSLDITSHRYHISQAGPGEPIEVVVRQLPTGPGSPTGELPTLIRMTYRPDGRFSSSEGQTPHAAPRRGGGKFFHDPLLRRLTD